MKRQANDAGLELRGCFWRKVRGKIPPELVGMYKTVQSPLLRLGCSTGRRPFDLTQENKCDCVQLLCDINTTELYYTFQKGSITQCLFWKAGWKSNRQGTEERPNISVEMWGYCTLWISLFWKALAKFAASCSDEKLPKSLLPRIKVTELQSILQSSSLCTSTHLAHSGFIIRTHWVQTEK